MKSLLIDEDGWGSVAGLFGSMILMVMGGFAIDVANAYRVEKQMQIATDAAALAAASSLSNQTMALDRARETLLRNLPESLHGQAIRDTDFTFGHFSEGHRHFVPTEHEDRINAVRVDAARSEERENRVPLYISQLLGAPDWTIRTHSVAMSTSEAIPLGCDDALIATRNFMQTGGGNEWLGSICLHGDTGVHTGGNDFYVPGVKLSALRKATITINHIARGSYAEDDPERLKVEQEMQFPLLESLPQRFNAIMSELSAYETGDIYEGDALPTFYRGKRVVHLESTWVTMKTPGTLQSWEQNGSGAELEDDTIYVAPGGVSIAGNVDADRVAIIAEGMINIGGGANVGYEDAFLFAAGQLGGSGAVQWGNPEHYCDAGRFNSYLLSLTSLSMGGTKGTYGVVGAAPRFNPGGAFRNSGGLHFETDESVSLGGNYRVEGCGEPLESEYEIFRPSQEGSVHAQLVE